MPLISVVGLQEALRVGGTTNAEDQQAFSPAIPSAHFRWAGDLRYLRCAWRALVHEVHVRTTADAEATRQRLVRPG